MKFKPNTITAVYKGFINHKQFTARYSYQVVDADNVPLAEAWRLSDIERAWKRLKKQGRIYSWQNGDWVDITRNVERY